jgi:hypothetical protein
MTRDGVSTLRSDAHTFAGWGNVDSQSLTVDDCVQYLVRVGRDLKQIGCEGVIAGCELRICNGWQDPVSVPRDSHTRLCITTDTNRPQGRSGSGFARLDRSRH